MKVLDGIPVPNIHTNHNMYYVKLVKLLYGLNNREECGTTDWKSSS
jgi:hypothetical protein